jgi:ABC-type multidrug transport system fused ATPase/permease subunit
VPQEAWVINASLRENVLLASLAPPPPASAPSAAAAPAGPPSEEGGGVDWGRYRRALFAAALEGDVASLAGGDLTEIGERGVTLSGGQKQRVRRRARARRCAHTLARRHTCTRTHARAHTHTMRAHTMKSPGT